MLPFLPPYPLCQKQLSCGPQTKSCLSVKKKKKSLLEHIHAHSFSYCPWLAAFALRWQSWITVTTWLEKPKILISGPLQKKLAHSALSYWCHTFYFYLCYKHHFYIFFKLSLKRWKRSKVYYIYPYICHFQNSSFLCVDPDFHLVSSFLCLKNCP